MRESASEADQYQLAVIVLAAGEGKRMKSANPKVLHPIGGRSLVGHALYAAAGLDPQHLVVVIGHGRERVAEHLDLMASEIGMQPLIAVQEQQRGTGHAVSCALDVLPDAASGTVVITYGDVPLLDRDTLRALLAEHAAAGNAVTVLTTRLADPTGYGRIVRDVGGRLTGIVEHADASPEQLRITEVNSGVYAFDTGVLRDALGRLSDGNAQGELYLTDAIAVVDGDGGRAGTLEITDTWLVTGVNDRVQLAAMRAELNRRLLERWMLAGVTVVDPATTWVDASVVLEPDVVLHPGTQLHGATAVARGAEVGPDTTLTDCEVGPGAVVVRSHGTGASIGPNATVGPYSYLRPGVRLGEAGKLGAFVEAKNSEIGRGSKVPHLSYVGDATIGEYSNIGAASVFVNYDGVAKHHTVVGSHVRTGSDNMFIAPVTVGDGAYTGAGTVVREDVPPGALAVSAGEQRVIEGWVQKRRPGTPAAEAAARAAGRPPESDAAERSEEAYRT